MTTHNKTACVYVYTQYLESNCTLCIFLNNCKKHNIFHVSNYASDVWHYINSKNCVHLTDDCRLPTLYPTQGILNM